MYAALSSQKIHMAVYLMGIYLNEQKLKWFEEEYAATGKKMDKSKSCVRFKKLEDLPLPLIGKAIGAYGIADFVEQFKKLRQTPNKNN